jgi:hypothetical protein
MTREEMVDALVEAHLNDIFEAGVEQWITERLRNGMPWKAYNQMTGEDLINQYRDRFSEEKAA